MDCQLSTYYAMEYKDPESVKTASNIGRVQTYHDQYQVFQAAESFFIGSISFTWDLIVKLWKKSATLQIIFHILNSHQTGHHVNKK